MMHARTYLAAAALGALVLGGGLGCSKKAKATPPKVDNAEVARLLREGENLLKHKEWDAGRKTLRAIEERYPSSPEFPKAKLLIADSFFFGTTSTYPEALVEYQSFLGYFPRHERRDYAQYRIALCHYATIENAERDQNSTRKAIEAFRRLVADNPGSPYAAEAKSKITQCWRRLAESELMVGVFYTKSNHFAGAEARLKQLLETYPDYVDRERAYYYLGEAMRQKLLPPQAMEQFQKTYLERVQKDELSSLSKSELDQYRKELKALERTEIDAYRAEARSYYQKLVESYPDSSWASRAKDRLIEMGQTHIKEELDS
ncbi:outer membrane protein assembly factor BamD [Holophaga foetida]|uniref:outer membrane protein assembly factor BamD n=1 Tax=Holophaga foetida TaxID=35839 RepID=UPI0002474D5E|nr:outer membrane protein assembly factor BamD [Holophaga foetida]